MSPRCLTKVVLRQRDSVSQANQAWQDLRHFCARDETFSERGPVGVGTVGVVRSSYRFCTSEFASVQAVAAVTLAAEESPDLPPVGFG